MERHPPRFVPTLTEVIELEPEIIASAPAPQTPSWMAAPAPEALAQAVRPAAVEPPPETVALSAQHPQRSPEAFPELAPAPQAPAAEDVAPATLPAAAAVDMEALVQAAVLAQLPALMAQLQPVVEDAIRTAVLRSLGHLSAAK